MTREALTAATEHTGDQGVLAQIRDAAIEQFDQHGFDTKFQAVAEAAGVSPALAIRSAARRAYAKPATTASWSRSAQRSRGSAIDVAGVLVRLAGPNRVACANHGLPRAQHAVRR